MGEETLYGAEPKQKQFLLFALGKLNWKHRFLLPQYEHRLLLLQMITLKQRRSIAQTIFILKVINGEISSSYIMNKLNIRVPSHMTRITQFFNSPVCRTNYMQYEPINYMLSTFNQLYCIKVTNSDIYIIDFDVKTDTIKHRIEEFFKGNL